jgi:hypothetical protein
MEKAIEERRKSESNPEAQDGSTTETRTRIYTQNQRILGDTF